MIYIKPWYLGTTEKKQLNDAIDELAGKNTSSHEYHAYQTVAGRSC